ncbi:MAG: GTPase ObgE [Candidatus Omnitrophica bacterium ADurb.Bin205]|nr:MAG: GTPase ObgE [Candidatus Omnitrophica bacterium ADurb.Bin205]
MRDLKEEGEQVIAALGGRGGLGNIRSPQPDTQAGSPGEERELFLNLKLIAQAGLVGFPNTGKSTLISSVSNAQPKVAAYPFTTKFPVLGVINRDEKRFVIADIPGLIRGSSEGKGLGDKFLRHVERTKVLIHVVDISGFEGRDPVEDYKAINQELKKYNKSVARKPQIIALNKMDLDGAKENLKRFRKLVKKEVYPISALKKEGLEELINAVTKKV